MQMVLEKTKNLMKEYGIKANKNLGQNFLISDETINNIVNSASVSENDLVIEIGPGLGNLTESLIEKAAKVIAIELDDRMLKILNLRFKNKKNLKLMHEDILKVNLNKLIEEEKGNLSSIKIVANLPYYITTPIIMKLLEEELPVKSITVMVQKEVADRITAKPSTKLSGMITYSVNYYAKATEVCFVSKDNFIPAPKVDSQVIKLEIRDKKEIELKDKEIFFKIIRASFMQRRKTLINALTNGNIIKDKQEAKELLIKLGIAENARGENLTMQQFADIANNI